jgi:transcriptional regulator with XRE-family HTH domain
VKPKVPTLAEVARGKRGVLNYIPLRTFGKFVGINAATLSRVENGRTPSAKTLLRIMRAFQLGPGDFRL